jgi:molybdate transport system substrate-binding protein
MPLPRFVRTFGAALCALGIAAVGAPAARAAEPLKILTLGKRVSGGEAFDVLVVSAAVLDQMVAAGRVAAPAHPLASVGIGVAAAPGVRIPEIATEAQFKAALLAARAVTYIDPASGGSSGIYLDGLFQRMGIAEAVRAKAVLAQGGLSAKKLLTGEAELALQQASELVSVPGVQWVGMLPAALQNVTVYGGGTAQALGADPARAARAKALLAELAGPIAQAAMRERRMDPQGAP